MSKWVILSLALAILVGCQQPPKTRVYRKATQDFEALSQSLKKKIEITEATRILDARSPLEYGLSHAESASNIQWDAFSQRNHAGLLNTNLNKISKRLALIGVSVETPVVVLGNGRAGQGEEGRVAWMLMYLGVRNVQTATLDSLKLRRAQSQELGPENVKNWSAKPNTHLLADLKEVMGNAVGKKDSNLHVIDVRSSKEYFDRDKKTEAYKNPELRGINIEWKEFFTNSGRPNVRMKKRLLGLGFKSNDRIIVMSDKGLRSGAVAYALSMMGFRNVGNLAAGLSALR